MTGTGRRWTVVLTVVSLLAISGAALGVPTESDDADTVFNVGYDEDFHVLFWSVSPNDGETQCEMENGDVTVDFGAEGAVEAVGFEDCSLSAAEVSGPNGQINHGMFMKLFNSLYEGQGRGCLNRHLAQLGLGKDDTKVKVSEVDPEFVSATEGDSADVAFHTFLTSCEKGKKNHSEDADQSSRGKGRPESPGKSGNAPGHNKSTGE